MLPVNWVANFDLAFDDIGGMKVLLNILHNIIIYFGD